MSLLIKPTTEKLFWSGLHEVAVQRAMSGLVKPGMTFWDVGANIGFFTILASRLVTDAGRVDAFEPMPENRERLHAALEANGCRNVTVHDCAVSAAAGETILYSHESSAMWSLLPTGDGNEGIAVHCETLDAVAGSVPAPDVIKIDVEGAELDALRGARGLLSKTRPTLLVEFSNEELLDEARSLLRDYDFERVDGNHWLLR